MLEPQKEGDGLFASSPPGTARHPSDQARQTAPRLGALPLSDRMRWAVKLAVLVEPRCPFGQHANWFMSEIEYLGREKEKGELPGGFTGKPASWQEAFPIQALPGQRQKRRFLSSRISSSAKNGVFGTIWIPGDAQTPFLARFYFWERSRRRFWHDSVSGRTPDGVCGSFGFPAGLKTAFVGHLDFPQGSRRRF